MRRIRHTCLVGAIALAGWLLPPPSAVADGGCDLRYSLTPLEIVPPRNPVPELVGVVNMNNPGQVIGFYLVDVSAPTGRAFVWSRADPVARDLGDLGGPGSFPLDINDRGTIVGAGDLPPVGNDLFRHAFRWHDGVMHDLGTLGGASSVASGINNWGFIVGAADTDTKDQSHAFLWSPLDEKMRDLGTLGGSDSTARAINNRGQVIGASTVGGGGSNVEHAFLWSPWERVMRDLGTLGGASSFAAAINDRGQVAGFSEIGPAGSCRHAFFWDGRMRDLGTLGGEQSEATGISIWGQVVGHSETASDPVIPCEGPRHAFIWSERCGLRDLNTLIAPSPAGSPTPAPILREVVISDLGQIIAGDPSQWYLLRPILWYFDGAGAPTGAPARAPAN